MEQLLDSQQVAEHGESRHFFRHLQFRCVRGFHGLLGYEESGLRRRVALLAWVWHEFGAGFLWALDGSGPG